MSNIHGLNSKNRNEVAKKQNEEEFSLGGATSSTAVYRPNNGVMREVIDRAREQSAQLGNNNNTTGGATNNDRSIGLITIYANGFIIGDGQFRDASDPKNASFIKDLKNGDVPREMVDMCQEQWGKDIDSVNVQLKDNSSEVYTPPKPKFNFAESKGQSLGASSSSSSNNSVAFQNLKSQQLQIDSSQPTASIQLVLADRRRLRETVNHSTTVADIYRHVLHLTQTPKFELVTGFPPKVLTDPNQTVKDAGLIGAQVQQRTLS
jgi:UBX domain-containing protein 1